MEPEELRPKTEAYVQHGAGRKDTPLPPGCPGTDSPTFHGALGLPSGCCY